MSKISFFLTTLIAAIPAAFLAFLAAMAFLQNADAMSGMLMAVTGLTLLLSVTVVALPAVVLLRKGAPKPVKDVAPAKADEAEAEEESWDSDEGDEAASAADEDDAFGDVDDLEGFDDEPRKK